MLKIMASGAGRKYCPVSQSVTNMKTEIRDKHTCQNILHNSVRRNDVTFVQNGCSGYAKWQLQKCDIKLKAIIARLRHLEA